VGEALTSSRAAGPRVHAGRLPVQPRGDTREPAAAEEGQPAQAGRLGGAAAGRAAQGARACSRLRSRVLAQCAVFVAARPAPACSRCGSAAVREACRAARLQVGLGQGRVVLSPVGGRARPAGGPLALRCRGGARLPAARGRARGRPSRARGAPRGGAEHWPTCARLRRVAAAALTPAAARRRAGRGARGGGAADQPAGVRPAEPRGRVGRARGHAERGHPAGGRGDAGGEEGGLQRHHHPRERRQDEGTRAP